jgi:plasmid maintenance system antidote protein VapI
MKTIINYLDDLKEKNGSDYRVAKLLKTNQTTISTIRNRNQCGEDTAIKIADLLGVSREEVLIAAAIARSNNEDAKHAWENISKRAGIAASIGFAAAYIPYFISAIYNQVCILC